LKIIINNMKNPLKILESEAIKILFLMPINSLNLKKTIIIIFKVLINNKIIKIIKILHNINNPMNLSKISLNFGMIIIKNMASNIKIKFQLK
jgi:hypothetical protein